MDFLAVKEERKVRQSFEEEVKRHAGREIAVEPPKVVA